MKNLDKFDIWDEWSKTSSSYDATTNHIIWNQLNNTDININYLCHLLKQKPYDYYKPYVPLDNLQQINQSKKINNKYVSEFYNYSSFKHHNTVVIESCTGSGKTTAVSMNIEKYLSKHDMKKRMISLVSRKTLASQHMHSFKNINLVHYEDENKNLKSDNLVICINSLLLLSDMTDVELEDTIVYIDEITSFISGITHNDTLQGKLKQIYMLLKKIIKNAHKVVVSDALITDATFLFLNNRDITPVFYQNEYLKYTGINAVRMNDENNFIDKLKDHCMTNKPFLFACDECRTITELYSECMNIPNIDKNKFILITGNTKYSITDASEQFKDKFVFYSPSITFGVDVSFHDRQDVFIYIVGKSIDPSAIFQQTTRTRNIDNLYYYSKVDKSKIAKYSSLDDVKTSYKDIITLHNNVISEVCCHLDENDDEVVIENSFFNLFTYNEYVLDIFRTNLLIHYEKMLVKNGFVLSSEGVKNKISLTRKQEMQLVVSDIKLELINEYIVSDDKTNDKYFTVHDVIQYLRLPTNKIDQYSQLISNKFELTDSLNTIKMLKSSSYIDSKILESDHINYAVKTFDNSFNKIKLIFEIEKVMQIGRLDVSFLNACENFVLSDELFKLIKHTFRTDKKKPDNLKDVQQLYISCLKNICGNKIINKEQKMINKMRRYYYNLNSKYIIEQIELNRYQNNQFTNYDMDLLLKLYPDVKIDETVDDVFTDDWLDVGIFDDE